MAGKYRVTPDVGLWIREGPSISEQGIEIMPVDTEIIELESAKDENDNTWIKHAAGWSAFVYFGEIYLEKIEDINQPQTTITPAPTLDDQSIQDALDVSAQIRSITEYTLNADTTFKLKSARSIMGLPHQFLPSTDERVPNSNFGRMFTESILMDMPICTIIPGGPRFLSGKGITQEQKNSMTSVLADAASKPATEVASLVEDILGGKNAKYYSFQTQFSEYMQYVNTLNRTAAVYLGIHKKSLNPESATYDDFNWTSQNIETDMGLSVLDFIGSHGTINFYFDKAGTGMTEYSSNSTDRSMLEGAMNSASGTVKEAQFLLGVGAGMKIESMSGENAEQRINALTEDIADQNKGVFKGIMDNLKAGVTTVVSGSNMLLPEIWRDSTTGASFSMDIHLATPYGTPEAYYLNVVVPLNFLLALALPRQFGANGYYSPMLIQAYSKGVFNVDMGIIDSINIARFGTGDSISRLGLPLEIRVSLTFKRLYNALALSKDNNYAVFVNNIALLDFLANLSGVSLNEAELTRKLNIWLNAGINRYRDIPVNALNKIFDNLRDSLINKLKY